jgi:hypothetical protein
MRTVQLTTDPDPKPFYDVSEGEYERLIDLGIVVNAPAAPTDPNLFDAEVAALVTDRNSSTYAAGRAAYAQAQSVAPSNPAVGQIWFS